MAHLTTEKYLHKENMLVYLDTLCGEISKLYPNDVVNFLIVGGSAIALKDGWRNATVDIDACYSFYGHIRKIVEDVADYHGILKDWFNSDVMKSNSYSRRLWDNAIFYARCYNVNIYVVCDLDQLCMKATAYRKKDLDDIMHIVQGLRLQGCTFDEFMQRYDYLYMGTVPMKSGAKSGIRKLFNKRR